MRRAFRLAIGSGLIAGLLAVAGLPSINSAPDPPPVDVLLAAFSVSAGSGPTGAHPADILVVGSLVAIPCENLGLVCRDAVTGVPDDLLGLSFDVTSLDALRFSVAKASLGLTGSAVRAEAGCAVAEAQGDVFETAVNGSNRQILDGDGAACGGNAGYALLINEGAAGDEVDAVEVDPCRTVDLDCDGIPELPVYFTLAPGSPSLGLFGASAADILVSARGEIPLVWAPAAALGLVAGDIVDGLCVVDDGSRLYDSGDTVRLSLRTGSPSLKAIGASGADVLRPGPLRIAYPAASLGLNDGDEVDALRCGELLPDILRRRVVFAPIVTTGFQGGW